MEKQRRIYHPRDMNRAEDEYFQIRQCRSLYNREANRFTFNISYETHATLTPRSLIIAQAFGLGIDQTQKFTVLSTELKISPTDIVLITGDSGSGKSVLLKALRADLADQAIDLNELKVEQDKPLIETVGSTVEEGLELLSKVGLNDAFLFLRPYNQLSDGQKFRYKLAKLIESKKNFFLIDEFAACLDRDTAKIIAFNLQKIARQHGKAVIAATTHNDLQQDLSPSVKIHKRFGEEIQVDYRPNSTPQQCSLIQEMRIEEGTLSDWNKLSVWHYRGHKAAVPRKIFKLTRKDELCGVVVFSYPPPSCYGRRVMLPRMSMKELNQQLCIVNRVVVHPKYRTIGLGAKLMHDTLPLAGTPYVEMIAVMAKYNPFAEKAGMQKIIQQETVQSITHITQTLEELGFDPHLTGSESYNLQKLTNLTPEETKKLKNAFLKDKHPRFKTEFSNGRGLPYGKTKDYTQNIQNADSHKMAKLIRITAMLQQTKVYLFWKKDQNQTNTPQIRF